MKYAKVNPLKKCPSVQQWSIELDRDHLPDSWTAHLEACTNCQRALEELAASSQLWREASETLSERVDDVTHIIESIVPLSLEPAQALISDPMCEYELAQLQKLLSERSSPATTSSSNGSLRKVSNAEPIATLGRYELEQLIGRGGMGLVFRAWDTELHRVVAVKTLGMTLWSMPSARQRFVREGRAAAMLNHPHIVPLYDVINDPPVPALVMQYIAGPTLDQWISDHGPMPWIDAVRVAWQLADALCAAHREGLVHRDIKPGNVLLEADGSRALLTDFGLVRAMDDATLTQSGLLAGTPHFMSPEQARGEDVDGRSDLFSLGALMYFAIAGQPPFRGRESMAVLNALCHSPHQSLMQISDEVPREVSQLVDQLLSKSAGGRPATSEAVRDRLRTLMDARPRLSKRRGPLLTVGMRSLVLLGMLAAAMLAWVPFFANSGVSPSSGRAVPYVSGLDASKHANSGGEDMMAGADRSEFVSPSSTLLNRTWTELDSLSAEVSVLEQELDNREDSFPMRGVHAESFEHHLQTFENDIRAVTRTVNDF